MRRWSRVATAALFVIGLVPWATGAALAMGEYFLPAPSGASLYVTQGNGTGLSGGDHAGTSEYAWDLAALGGAAFEVAAARAGIVESVRTDALDGNCPDAPETAGDCWIEANHVVVDHLDGTAALYLHLAQGSSADLVPGDPVALGQVIGRAGSSGTTGGAQLHFMVMSGAPADPPATEAPGWWRQSVPVSFSDASIIAAHADGVPGNGLTPDGPFVSSNPGAVGAPGGGEPIARPAGLPARLPWASGERYSLAESRDPALPGGLGFEVVPGPGDPITSEALAFPLFGGTLRYAGCATGASAGLGRIVVIERELEGHTYQAVHAHLSALDPLLTAAPAAGSVVVSASEPIGTFGSSVTAEDGTCDGVDGGAPRLLFALLQDATVSPTGQILGGTPVRPGTFVGRGAYQWYPWWQGPMRAIDVNDKAGLPTASWASTTTPDRSHVFLGRPVSLAVQARGPAGLREVRFLVRYQDWPVKRALARFPGLEPDKDWRILAVCRPPGVRGEPRTTKGCQWNGDARRATVTYLWDPAIAERSPLVPWLPPGRAAIGEKSQECVPTTFTYEVYDAAGHQALEPRGRIAFKCDARGPLLGRNVSIDPLRPPATPAAVTLTCAVQEELGCAEYALTWRDTSPNEEGFRVYAESAEYLAKGWPACRFKVQSGPWLLATLKPGTKRWRPDYASSAKVLQRALGKDRPWLSYGLSVSAFNKAGESPRTKATGGQVFAPGDVFCQP
jgi:hypothetical protein